MKTDTISLEDVHRMLGERDIALDRLNQEVARLTAENQRLRTDLAEATKDKVAPTPVQ